MPGMLHLSLRWLLAVPLGLGLVVLALGAQVLENPEASPDRFTSDRTAALLVAISATGSRYGGPFVALAGLAMALAGATPRWSRPRVLAGILLIAGLVAGGGAWLNEHVVKPGFAVPRPNIEAIAGASGPLGMTAEQFYSLGDKAERQVFLETALDDGWAPDMPDAVRAHWIEEAGYSFPSGHSFGAFFLAAFFGGLALVAQAARPLGPILTLTAWAVAVGLSRIALGVHTPADVTVGALQGIVLGALTLPLVARLARA